MSPEEEPRPPNTQFPIPTPKPPEKATSLPVQHLKSSPKRRARKPLPHHQASLTEPWDVRRLASGIANTLEDAHLCSRDEMEKAMDNTIILLFQINQAPNGTEGVATEYSLGTASHDAFLAQFYPALPDIFS